MWLFEELKRNITNFMTDSNNLKPKLAENSNSFTGPSANENKKADIGSKKCPFKLAIIGAGPAGVIGVILVLIHQ